MINPFSGVCVVCVCACCGSDLFHQAFCLARQNCSPWKLSLLDQICCWKKAEKCTQTGLPKSTWFGHKNFGEIFHQNLLEIDWNLRDFSKFLNHALSMQTVPQCATPGCIQFRHLGLGSSLRNNIPTGSPCSQRLGSPTAECRLHTIHSAKETQRTTSLWKTRKALQRDKTTTRQILQTLNI